MTTAKPTGSLLSKRFPARFLTFVAALVLGIAVAPATAYADDTIGSYDELCEAFNFGSGTYTLAADITFPAAEDLDDPLVYPIVHNAITIDLAGLAINTNDVYSGIEVSESLTITGDGAITGAGNQAITLVGNSFTLESGTISGAADTGVWAKKGVVEIKGGDISGASMGIWVYTADATLKLSGAPSITGRGCGIWLDETNPMVIAGPLTYTTPISVDWAPSTGVCTGVFTSGYSASCGKTDPSTYFTAARSGYKVVRVGDEAAIVRDKPTVTFVNDDEAGTVLQSSQVDYPTAPAYSGETPTKEASAQYTYTFSGWTDGTNNYALDATLPAPMDDITYTATYTETPIQDPVTSYDLWIGNTQVSSANLSGEGWSYDPDSKTLALDDPVITGSHGRAMIYVQGDLTIRGRATLTATDNNNVILCYDGKLTFAEGELNLTSQNDYGVWVRGDVEIRGGTMTFTGAAGSSGISATGSVSISEGTVTCEGGAGLSTDGNITITGGTVTGRGTQRAGIKAKGTLSIGPGVTKVSAEGKVYLVWTGAVSAGSIELQAGVQITKPVGGTIGSNDSWTYIEDDKGAIATTAEFEPDPIHTVTVVGGTADKETAAAGETVTITCDEPDEGVIFNQWAFVDGVDFAQGDAWQTTFTMPNHDVKIEAVFRDIVITDVLPDVVYTGDAFEPTFSFFGVQVEGSGVLWPGSNYELSYQDNVNVGEAKVILKVIDNRMGSKTVTFRILPANISDADVVLGDAVYAGEETKPAATITWNGKTLKEGTDYTLTVDSVEEGEGTATITGKGNFTGTLKRRFTITPTTLTITAKPQTYTYNGEIQGEGSTAYEDPAEIAEKIKVTGLQGDDAITSIVLDGRRKDFGTEELVPSNAAIGEMTGNYKITYVPGTLEIEPKPVIITVDDASKASGMDDPAFTGTIEGLLKEGDLGEVTYSRTNADEAAGSYEGVLTASYEANPNYDVTVVNGDFTIRQTYTVRWLDGDGSELGRATYAEGDPVPSYTGDDPTKAPTAQYSYAFMGWDEGTADGATTTFRPLFSETLNEYTVTFVNEDDTVLQSSKITYGETPAYTGEAPTKPTTERFTYAFAGWSPEVVPVTGDAIYTATYEATPITATLTFDLAGGTLDGKTGTITMTANVGDVITIPQAPTRAGYTFKYWKGSKYHPGDKYEVTGNHTFTAVWEKAAEQARQPGGKANPTLPATGDGSARPIVALSVAMLGTLCVLAGYASRCRAHRR